MKDCLTIPVVANGDIRSLQDAEAVHTSTGVDGNQIMVMVYI